MKKFAILTVVLSIWFSCFIFTSCSQNSENNHEHSFTQSILSPTCEEPSYLVSKCICGVEESRSIFDDPLGHKFGEYVYDNNATCEEDGTETAICTRDNCSKIDVRVKEDSALGHKFGEYVYDNNATCEEDGTETATCTRDDCNKTDVKVKESTALGHDLNNDGECSRCDYKLSVGISYRINGDYYVVDGIGSCTDKNIRIPEFYNGKKVMGIDGGAFAELTFVETIEIPNSIEIIYDGAFAGCYNLSEIKISEDSNLQYVGAGAFGYCINLTSITLPSNLNALASDAFYGCVRLVEAYNLSNFNISTNIINYESNGHHFLNVYKNKKDSKLSKNGDYILYTSGDEIFLINYVGNATEITIPNYVTQIHIGAFINNKTLKKVNIPNSVRVINGGAFAYSNISEITIPKTIESLGWSAFRSSDIERVTFEDNGKLVGISDYTFYDCQNLQYVKLGNTIKNIGDYAFSKCSKLKDFNFVNANFTYDHIKEMGLIDSENREYGNAYYLGVNGNPYYILLEAKSKDIETCEINPNCKIIADNAFLGCNKLKEITIPSSIIEIGDRAFHYCASLTKVVIPNCVEKIGSFVFTYCHSLETLYCENSSKKQGWEKDWDRKSYYGGSGNKFTIIWNYNS